MTHNRIVTVALRRQQCAELAQERRKIHAIDYNIINYLITKYQGRVDLQLPRRLS